MKEKRDEKKVRCLQMFAEKDACPLLKNGEVDEEVFKQYCSSRKKTILNEIKDYIKIRESNFHALDYLEEVSIS